MNRRTTAWLMILLLWANAAGASCAFRTETAAVGAGTISYNTAGEGPPILLLHGLFASKEQWTDMLCRLAAAGYQPYAPDLPGYGKSTGFHLTAYRLERQVELLRRFSRKLGIDRFDIAGSSMGGTIASLYRDRYPAQIDSLAYIGSPLGIVEWAAGVRGAIFRGTSPFIPINERQFDLEMRLLFVHPPEIPDPEKKAIIADYVARNRHYVQVWNIVNLYDNVLRVRRPSSTPSLILWGDQDRIYDVAGAAKLKRRTPNSELHQLAGAGHLLLMENADQAAALYVAFLGSRREALPEP